VFGLQRVVELMKKLKIVELYAGTARSVEPFQHWRRAEIALLVDASEHARETYLLNHAKAPYVEKDISKLSPGELLSLAGGRVDIIMGCPPCQGFSETGLRLSNDPRNKHVHHFARLADALRPLAVVMENVPRVGESEEFAKLVRLLEHAGYKWSSTIANSAQYGSCQSRQRLLFIALRGDVGVEPKFPRPTHGGKKQIFSYSTLAYRCPSEHPVELLGVTPASQRLSGLMRQDMALKLGSRPMITVGETLEGLPKAGTASARDRHHVAWSHSKNMLRRMERVAEGGRWRGGLEHYSHTYGRLHRRGLARTITTFFAYAGNGRFWHPTENRSLTLRESARIQGFSDAFRFLEYSKRSAALVGNALDYPLASICYSTVRQALE
jgi:DNA (cytosine-5)-methyltransferase 1